MTFLGQGKWQCLDCGYESKRNHCRDHVEAKHMQEIVRFRYVCEYCSLTLKNNMALKKHKASGKCKVLSHMNQVKLENIDMKIVKEWWIKRLINAIFSSDVIDSLMINLGGGKWQCGKCEYLCSKINVQMHIEAKHVVSDGYICPYCDQLLKNKIALKNHLARKHKNPVSYVQTLWI